MKRFFGNWVGMLGDEVVKSLKDHYIPAYPLFAFFMFLGASLFFFAGLTAFVIGLWFVLASILTQNVAIWTLFAIFAFLTLISILIGLQLLKPRKSKIGQEAPPPTIGNLVGSFLDGFFKR